MCICISNSSNNSNTNNNSSNNSDNSNASNNSESSNNSNDSKNRKVIRYDTAGMEKPTRSDSYPNPLRLTECLLSLTESY